VFREASVLSKFNECWKKVGKSSEKCDRGSRFNPFQGFEKGNDLIAKVSFTSSGVVGRLGARVRRCASSLSFCTERNGSLVFASPSAPRVPVSQFNLSRSSRELGPHYLSTSSLSSPSLLSLLFTLLHSHSHSRPPQQLYTNESTSQHRD